MAFDALSVQFFGDLDDPWIVEIADALPGPTDRSNCPDLLPIEPPTADVLVVHRAILGTSDTEVLHGWREQGSRIILCIGPHVRARDVERLGPSVDVILNEATASATIGRHLTGNWVAAPRDTLPLLVVVAASFEVRKMLVEAAETAGFPARGFENWAEATPSRLAIWDAPVLEQNWEQRLIEPSRRRSVLAVLGFADRQSVASAKASGAMACIDFPCDMADLAFVLDRLASQETTTLLIDGPHAIPPQPRAGLRVVRPPVADFPRKP